MPPIFNCRKLIVATSLTLAINLQVMKKITLGVLVLLTACSTTRQAATTRVNEPGNTVINGKIFATIFQQKAAEYRALCYQAYNMARLRLDAELQNTSGKPKALVTDIDETVLDNSPQQASDILHHTTYTEKSWKDWTSKATAEALAGAVAFFQYADKMGVQCFYVSNRRPEERDASIRNLLNTGFPQADTVHVMMKDTTSDKEPRRSKINQQFTIALLIGDNLNDFDKMFYKQSSYTRCNLVRDNSNLFGDIFIILPNAMYGDWESAIWNGKKVTPVEADKLKHEALAEY